MCSLLFGGDPCDHVGQHSIAPLLHTASKHCQVCALVGILAPKVLQQSHVEAACFHVQTEHKCISVAQADPEEQTVEEQTEETPMVLLQI